jgi:hypothetical protein
MTPNKALLIANAADTMMRLIETLQDADEQVAGRFPKLSEIYSELDAIENAAIEWGAELLADAIAPVATSGDVE